MVSVHATQREALGKFSINCVVATLRGVHRWSIASVIRRSCAEPWMTFVSVPLHFFWVLKSRRQLSIFHFLILKLLKAIAVDIIGIRNLKRAPWIRINFLHINVVCCMEDKQIWFFTSLPVRLIGLITALSLLFWGIACMVSISAILLTWNNFHYDLIKRYAQHNRIFTISYKCTVLCSVSSFFHISAIMNRFCPLRQTWKINRFVWYFPSPFDSLSLSRPIRASAAINCHCSICSQEKIEFHLLIYTNF